jgi:hypothetical protein
MLPRRLSSIPSASLQPTQRSSAPRLRLVMTISYMSRSIRRYSVLVERTSPPNEMQLSRKPDISDGREGKISAWATTGRGSTASAHRERNRSRRS